MLGVSVKEIVDFFVRVFQDSPEYAKKSIMRVPEEYRFIDVVNSEVVVTLFLLPLRHDLWYKHVSVGYFMGFACDKKYRGSGRAKHLFVKMLKKAFNDGIDLLEGQSANAGLNKYYKDHFQLQNIDFGEWLKFKLSEQADSNVLYIEEVDSLPSWMLTQMLADNEHCLIPNDESISTSAVYVDYYLAKNKEGVISGIVGVDRSELPYLYILITTDKYIAEILSLVCKKYNVRVLYYKKQGIKGNRQSNGLCRIINVKRVLSIYAACHPLECQTYFVTDPYIESNNGIFMISNGECSVGTIVNDACMHVTIGELTALLVKPFYMPVSYY